MQFIVKTFAGLETLLRRELLVLGGKKVTPLKRAVSCEGDLEFMYKAMYQSRLAIRVLKVLKSDKITSVPQLYASARNVPWEKIFRTFETFRIDVTVNSPLFTHSQFAALKVKDAIVDKFRDMYGRRPSVDRDNPDFVFHLNISNDQVHYSMDPVGESLHRRRYRLNTTAAPINEVLAAGLLQLSGWEENKNFVDIMCGSGTMLAEAMMHHCHVPPGYLRKKYACFSWDDFDKRLWLKVKKEADSKITEPTVKFTGIEIDRQTYHTAKQNLLAVPNGQKIEIHNVDFFEYENEEESFILSNPPYDERLEEEDIDAFYKQIGDRFKYCWKGSEAWLISSNIEALKRVGLKPDDHIQVYNGPLLCSFKQFKIF